MKLRVQGVTLLFHLQKMMSPIEVKKNGKILLVELH